MAVIPSVARPTGGAWYEGSDLRALAEATGIIEACFYEPSAMRVKADLFDIRRRLRGTRQAARHPAAVASRILRARASSSPRSAALRAGGVDELAFYNWGHLRRANLDWIGEALAGMSGAVRRQDHRHHRRRRRHRPVALPVLRRGGRDDRGARPQREGQRTGRVAWQGWDLGQAGGRRYRRCGGGEGRVRDASATSTSSSTMPASRGIRRSR